MSTVMLNTSHISYKLESPIQIIRATIKVFGMCFITNRHCMEMVLYICFALTLRLYLFLFEQSNTISVV